MRNPPQTREFFADLQGRKLYGWVSGEGSPAVIIDTGLGDTAAAWSHIQTSLAGFTTVFSYDRAGLGRSDPAPTPRTCEDIVSDLRLLLAAANLPPPYVLVAHSWSGLNARYFANQFPQEVTGMLLVDAVHEGKYERFAKVMSEERAQRMWAAVKDPQKNDEHIDRMASFDQVSSSQRLYDFPLIVLTRAADGELLSQIEIDLQAEFLKLSTHSQQYFSQYPDHFTNHAEPALIVTAIRQVVEMVRKS
jgi:pimeloyl-ACP methyl ester carboxylesterase